MKIIPQWPPRDPVRFIVHGFFGLIMGAVMGLGVYIYPSSYRFSESWVPLAIHMGIGSLIIGLVAGVYGDDFWEDIKHWW